MPALAGFLLTLLAACLPSHGAAQTEPSIAYPVLSIEKLRGDFDQLRNLIMSRHPLIYANRQALDAEFAKQRELLTDGMNELEFFRVLSRLVSQVNCGHTSISLSSTTEQQTSGQRRYVPLVIEIVDGRLHVTGAAPEHADLIGREVVAINGRTSGQIIRQLYDAIPADGQNLTRKIKFINRGFGAYYHEHVDTAGVFDVGLQSPGNATVSSVILNGISPEAWSRLRPSGEGDDVEIASYDFTDTHARLWVKSFNFYTGAGMQRFREVVDAFFAELAERKSPNLILDLRGNGGGEPRLGAYVLSHLIRKPTLYFTEDAGYYPTLRSPTAPAANAYTGPLFVLVDGDVFSTNGHLVSLLKYHDIGFIIGEETGGSYSCTANNTNAVLTHSRLRLSYATSTFTTAVQGLPPARGVFPDEEILPDVHDVVARRDVVMDRALFHVGAGLELPVITAHPAAQTVELMTPVSLVVQAEGQGLSYQWRRDGVPLSVAGAETAMLSLSSFSGADVGDYDVLVRNAAGEVTSASARLSLGRGNGSRLINLSSRGELGSPADVLIAGFAISGDAPRTVLIRGLGPALADLGVERPLMSPQLALFSADREIDRNSGWKTDDAALVREVSTRVGAFALPEDGRDCVLLVSLQPGTYTAHLRMGSAVGGVGLIEVYDASEGGRGALVNLSALVRLPDASATSISGLVVTGDAPQTVLVRAIGPGLAEHGVIGPLSIPRLTLYAGSAPVRYGSAYADTDRAPIAEVAASVGAFTLAPAAADHVLLATLQPGAYTLVAETETPGWLLTEVYAVPKKGVTP